MRRKLGKKNKILWVSILLVSITAYGLGLITARYKIFPYKQIKYFKKVIFNDKKINPKAGVEKSFRRYYLEKTSFFEVCGIESEIVMIGDSITDRAEWNELFPNLRIINRGIAGDTTKGVLNRMESIYSTNAKKAFIMIGINDLGKSIPVSDVLYNYMKIIALLKEHEIKPYIQSVLLVGDKYNHRNKNVLKLNAMLKELAEKKNIVFIDLNKALSENNKLKDSYSFDDIHLNGDGYFVWKNCIKEYLK
jgi:lysophospholipase L1-like esterase